MLNQVQHDNTYWTAPNPCGNIKETKMKNSGIEWIGEIPDGWEVSRVKNFLSERTGGAWGDEKKNNANDIICLRIADFDYSRFKFNNSTELTIRNYNTDIIEKLLLKKDDILVEKSGGGDKTPVGRAVIFENSYKALFANFMDRLRVRNNISALFFLYVWTTYYDNKYMLPYVKQTTGIQNLDITSILSGVFFPLPPKSTQQRIASYLDKKCSKIEETIQNQQQVIEKLKAYKQSLITEAVTGKVKIANGKICGEYESYKDSGVEYLGKIPSNWNVKRLRYIGKCQNGISKGGEFFGSGYPFVSYGDVYNNLVLPETVSGLIESTPEEQENYSVTAGDIFFTRTSETIEEVGFTSVCLKTIEKATFAGFVIRVRPFTEELVPDYSKYYFSSDAHRRFFVKEMNLVTRASLSQDLLKRLPVLIPSKEEQKEIANYLDKKCIAIDTAIEQKQNLIEKLTEYKKSLIYECVTGKKEI